MPLCSICKTNPVENEREVCSSCSSSQRELTYSVSDKDTECHGALKKYVSNIVSNTYDNAPTNIFSSNDEEDEEEFEM